MFSHEDFLQKAVALAVDSVQRDNGGPFGALVVKDGEIIGQGTNQVTAANDPTAHAVINAIRAACKRLGVHQLQGCVLYSSCEPCPMCLGAIYWARPALIVYAGTRVDAASAGFDDAFIYQEFLTEHDARRIPIRHIELENRIEPFRLWLAKDNREGY